jgi:cytochrome c peroxidase
MNSRNLFGLTFLFFFGVVLTACNPKQTEVEAVSPAVSTVATFPAAANSPADNPATTAKITLGKLLFWDPILSGGKDVACATCHHPDNAYGDGLDLSIGANAVGYGATRRFLLPNDIAFAKRNAQTVLNTAFNGMDASGAYSPATAIMFWDGRTQSLENQALGPVVSLEEMRGHAYTEAAALDSVVARLQQIAEYRQLFQTAFGAGSRITSAQVGQAIAAFERTLTAMNTPFDRYQKGDKTALTAQQIQGMQTFQTEGCAACHSGTMFSDYQLHILSVPDNGKLAASDAGAGNTYAFRTPSLRNVALTAPYMHNGAFRDLNQTVAFYDRVGGGNSQNPRVSRQQLDVKLQRINLRPDEQTQIVAFLNALTDNNFDKTIPATVPSRLNPGGNIR